MTNKGKLIRSRPRNVGAKKKLHPEALLSKRPASKYEIHYFDLGQGFINIGAPVHINSQWFPLDSAEEANMNMNSLPSPKGTTDYLYALEPQC